MAFRVPMMVPALVLLSALASTVQAQTNRLHLGPRISYEFDLRGRSR